MTSITNPFSKQTLAHAAGISMATKADEWEMFDPKPGITKLIDDLLAGPLTLYMDVEGIGLSRHGSIPILQIHEPLSNRTILVDVLTLGKDAFATPGSDGETTLKAMLESDTMVKYFFDVRNDSDALSAHFGITLAGVRDMQLQVLASRYGPKRFLNGLAKCIERDSGLNWAEKRAWQITKDAGVKLSAPERGGAREVINERPLPEVLAKYCAQDVCAVPCCAYYISTRPDS